MFRELPLRQQAPLGPGHAARLRGRQPDLLVAQRQQTGQAPAPPLPGLIPPSCASLAPRAFFTLILVMYSLCPTNRAAPQNRGFPHPSRCSTPRLEVSSTQATADCAPGHGSSAQHPLPVTDTPAP